MRLSFPPSVLRRLVPSRAARSYVLAGALAVGALGVTLMSSPLQRGQAPMIQVANAGELTELFKTRGYVADLGASKPVAVPRILLAALPPDLDAMAVPAERKALFLRALLPLVLTVNEEIAADRAQLLALEMQLAAGAAATAEQTDWIAALARRYGVALSDGFPADIAELLPELLSRVDMVPPSLAVAQAALESGWGTSRLAREGNALFGERTWSKAGLEPLAPEAGASHRARSFARLLDAVAAYVGNLNTHPAYAEFRQARASARDAGEVPAGATLVRHLTRYSELGAEYTKAVRGLIRANDLETLDRAELLAEGDTA
jgi:Bax protein